MQLFTGLVGLLLVITAQQTLVQGSIITTGIKNFIENFRVNMKCGFPQINAPVLVPLNIASWPLSVSSNELSLRADLLQVSSNDLDTFRIVSIDFGMFSMRMDMHFNFPQLRATGKFEQAIGRSPGDCLLFGNGTFAVSANDVNYIMSSRLVVSGGTLQMGEMSTRITFGSFNSNVASFVGSQAQSDQCNVALEKRMPAIMVASEKQVSSYFEGMFRPIANNFISGMSLMDLLGIISLPSNPVPTCSADAPQMDEVEQTPEEVVAF